ncbi:MAG: SHOCT domain-containing protein [Rhizobiaceae bacterium]
MMYGWQSGMGGGMLLGWLIFLVVIGLGIWLVAKVLNERGHGIPFERSNDAESILDQRFAKGEIDEEEYQKRRKALQG